MITYSRLLRSVTKIRCHPCRVELHLSAVNLTINKPANLPDPFGLAGEENVDEMIQGIYMHPRKEKKPKSDQAVEESSSDVTESQAKEGREEVSPTAKYGHWIRSSAERKLAADPTNEAVHNPHFGQIRLDSENVVILDGQFDPDFFDTEGGSQNSIYSEKYDRLAKRALRNVKSQGEITEQDKYRQPSSSSSPAPRNIQGSSNFSPNQSVNVLESPVPRRFAAPQQQQPPPPMERMFTRQENVRPDENTFYPSTASTQQQQSGINRMYPSVNENFVQEAKESVSSSGHPPRSSPDTEKKKTEGKNVVEKDPDPKTVAEYLKLRKLKKLAGVSKPNEVKNKLGGKEINMPKSAINELIIRHIPREYETIDYNNMTHEDMWFFLRKEICFENNFLIALNKPARMPMHSESVHCRHKVTDFLPDFAKHANVEQVFTCHRLDKDTTGVLLLAKSKEAATAIKHKFANRTMAKLYFAITKNCPEIREGTIKIPIAEGKIPNTKHDTFRAVLKPDLREYNITTLQRSCKEAITKFKVLQSRQYASFLEVMPETGITHQIRVHLAHGLGCPVLGDHKYAHRDKFAPMRLHDAIIDDLKVRQSKVRLLPLHLHCSKIEFTMPDGFMSKPWNEPIFVHASPPRYFMHTLRALRLK